jgi:hypothetical protein
VELIFTQVVAVVGLIAQAQHLVQVATAAAALVLLAHKEQMELQTLVVVVVVVILTQQHQAAQVLYYLELLELTQQLPQQALQLEQ